MNKVVEKPKIKIPTSAEIEQQNRQLALEIEQRILSGQYDW